MMPIENRRARSFNRFADLEDRSVLYVHVAARDIAELRVHRHHVGVDHEFAASGVALSFFLLVRKMPGVRWRSRRRMRSWFSRNLGGLIGGSSGSFVQVGLYYAALPEPVEEQLVAPRWLFSYAENMEVRFNTDLQAQLDKLAAETGRKPGELVEDALAGPFMSSRRRMKLDGGMMT